MLRLGVNLLQGAACDFHISDLVVLSNTFPSKWQTRSSDESNSYLDQKKSIYQGSRHWSHPSPRPHHREHQLQLRGRLTGQAYDRQPGGYQTCFWYKRKILEFISIWLICIGKLLHFDQWCSCGSKRINALVSVQKGSDLMYHTQKGGGEWTIVTFRFMWKLKLQVIPRIWSHSDLEL